MRNARLLLLVPALLLFAAGRSDASILFTANLNNASENPPTVPMTSGGQARPASFGTATFEMDDAMTFMSFTATIFNIDVTGTQTPDVNDNLGNAHIHASATVTPTTNGPVVWGFFGSPFNDNNPNDAVVTPFATRSWGDVQRDLESAGRERHDAVGATGQHPVRPVLHQLPHDAIYRRRNSGQYRADPGTGLTGAAGVGDCGQSAARRRKAV